MMFSIRLAYFVPLRQPTRRSRKPAGTDRLRTIEDSSVTAYDCFNAQCGRAFRAFPYALRALRRIAGTFMGSLLEVMYERRRKQAMAVLSGYRDLMNAQGQMRAPVSQYFARSRDGISFDGPF